jgi:acetoacetyl-CoA reductase
VAGAKGSASLAALGYKVVTTHSPGNTKSKEWLDGMNKMGYGFRAYPCDVADWDSCVACAQKVAAEVGSIDVLVNNAGITRDTTFKKMDRGGWDAVMHTNLDSCFNMTKQVCDGMVDRGWGRIINISSVNGQKAPSARSILGGESGHAASPRRCARSRAQGCDGQHDFPGYRHQDGDGDRRKCSTRRSSADPMGRLGAGRGRRSRGVSVQREAAFVTSANIAINGGQHMF